MPTTKINLSVKARGLGDNLRGLVAKVTIEAISEGKTPVRVLNEMVIFSEKGEIVVGPNLEELIIELEPTDATFCYRWRIETDVANPFVVYTSVPYSVTPIDFGDLKEVDPETFQPSQDVVTAWHAVLKEVDSALLHIRELSSQVAESTEVVKDSTEQVLSAVESTDSDVRAARLSATAADSSANSSRLSSEAASHAASEADESASLVTTSLIEIRQVESRLDVVQSDVKTSSDASVEAARRIALSETAIHRDAEAVATDRLDVARDLESVGLVKSSVDLSATAVSEDRIFVASAKKDVIDAKEATLLAKKSVDDSKSSVDLSKTSVEKTKDQIDQIKTGIDTTKSQIDQTKLDVDKLKTDTAQLKTDTNQLKTDTQNFKEASEKAKADTEKFLQTATFLYVATADISGTLDLSGLDKNSIVHRRLIGNITNIILPSNPTNGQTITLILTQDSVGSRTLVKPSGVLTSYGFAPSLSTAPNSVDVLHLWRDGVRWWIFVGALGGA